MSKDTDMIVKAVKTGKAATRAKDRYNEKAYDRVFVRVKKDRKALYMNMKMLEQEDMSLNKIINDMLEHCLLHDKEYAEYEALARQEGTTLDELVPQLLSAHFNE